MEQFFLKLNELDQKVGAHFAGLDVYKLAKEKTSAMHMHRRRDRQAVLIVRMGENLP